MAPVSGSSEQSAEKKGKSSRFSMKKKKKEDKTPSPEKDVATPDQSALLSPQTGSERRDSDSSSLNRSTVGINTPDGDTPKRKSGLNMSFKKKKGKGKSCGQAIRIRLLNVRHFAFVWFFG